MYFCGDSPAVIAWMLAHDAEIERRDLAQSNTTPLIHATVASLNDVVELLLQCGANANASTIIDDDDTALMIAVKAGNERVVKLLLAYGAETTRKNRWGQDAETLARLRGHFGLCHLLRKAE